MGKGNQRVNDYVEIKGSARALLSFFGRGGGGGGGHGNGGGRGRGNGGGRGRQEKAPTKKIYVGGINDSVTREHLEELFGKTERVWVVRSQPGFAHINFETEQAATDAVVALNGEDFKGCKLRVEISRQKPSGERSGGGKGPRWRGRGVASGGATGTTSASPAPVVDHGPLYIAVHNPGQDVEMPPASAQSSGPDPSRSTPGN